MAKLHWGVAGVAWATFIAQGISAVLALVTLLVRLQKFAGTERVPLFDRKLFVQILAIAVPSILQQSVLSVGNLFVQDIVNRYGSAVVAGYSGAIKLNTFAINIFMTLGSCLSSYTAQNIGAGKQERIPMGFRTGLKLSELTALPFVVLYFGLSQQMMGLFLNAESSAAIHAGVMFLRIVSPWYFMIVVKLMTDGIIRVPGNDLLCHRDDSGPDSSNRICTDAFAQIWKYGNLDGVAVRVDRSNCIDDYFYRKVKKWIWNEKCRWSEMTGGVFCLCIEKLSVVFPGILWWV